MYRSILAIVAMLAIGAASAKDQSATERELIKLENAWGTACQKHDSAFLQKLFAAEFLFTDLTAQHPPRLSTCPFAR
jgi:hypothetical protein